jgi:ABC-type glycerol-3-phosphate transport system substrate-binding protein
MSKQISRKEFLTLLGTGAAGAALAACAPVAPAPAPVPAAAEVEQAPAATEAPPAATQAPAPPKVEIQFDAGGYCPSKYIGRDLEEGEPARVAFDDVANAYMELHPDVKITFMPIPMGNRREVMITQLTGGTAPDLLWTQPDWVNEDLGKGWWMNLDPYLDMPSPYSPADNPGAKKWHDSFYPSVDFWRAPDGHLYMLLGDQTQVGFYYNKDIFSKAGITAEPMTWVDMIAAAEKVKAAGFPGFAWCGGGAGVLDQLTWTTGWLAKYFFWKYMSTYDTNKNGWADKWEMGDAIKAGTYSANMEEQVARLRTLKDMAVYWQDGALGMDWEAVHRLFLTGGAGMEITGVWMLANFLKDPERKFELGWFYFPEVTKVTSSLIPDGVPMTNLACGYGSFQFALTNTALAKNSADACADFLMFSTTPENIGKIVNEVPSTIPNVVGSTLNPLTVQMGFADSIKYPPSVFQEDDSLLDYEYGMNFSSVVGPYCVGQLDEAAMLEQLQGYMNAAADRVLATRPA